MSYCIKCGKKLTDKMAFCPACGTKVEAEIEENPDSSTHQEQGKTSQKTKRLPKKFFIGLLTIIVVIGIIATSAVYFLLLKPSSEDDTKDILPKNFSDDIEAIATAEASVVKVICHDHNGKEIATGSGVVMFHDDMIVTNYHVVEDVYFVQVSTDQDITFNVSGIWHKNEKQDIAILKLEKSTGLPVLKTGDPSSIKKGETVTAIGSPLGIKNTISKGNLSARIPKGDYDVLQFTAPISHGSSGGALFNENGELVGITYASFTEGQNLNLAVPIDLVEYLYQTKSLSIAPEPFDKIYWKNHIDSYYNFTYGDPIEVTLDQLKYNPSAYDDKYIKITAHVSSIHEHQKPVLWGIYLANLKDISSNINNDKEKDDTLNFVEHPYVYVCFHGYGDFAFRKNIKIEPSAKVEVIGVFSYWEQGEKKGDGTGVYEHSSAVIDIAYLNGKR